MDSGIATALVTVVVVAFLLWFVFGTQRNIAKGNRVLAWLQQGLPLLGERTTLRWLGSTAAQLNIANAKAPFSEAEVLVVLEPRDLGWLWAWSRKRGRRDFLILRGRLQRAPRLEIEAGDPVGWTGDDRLKRLDWDAWHEVEWHRPGIRVACSGEVDVSGVRVPWDSLCEVAGSVWRLSIRREHPHVEVHVPLPQPESADSAKLTRAFLDLGNEAIGR
jgi:hypothetical protein